MTKSGWIKLSGWFMVASGALFVIGGLAGSRPIYNEYNAASWAIDPFLNGMAFPFMMLGMVCTAFGILGLRARFGKRLGLLAQTGLLLSLVGIGVALVGTIGLSISDTSPWWESIMLGETALFLGLIPFGVACMRQKLLPFWNGLPLITNSVWPLLFGAEVLRNLTIQTVDMMPELVSGLGLLVAFGGLGMIGFLLQKSETNRTQAQIT